MAPGPALGGRSRWGALLGMVLLVLLWWFTSGDQDGSADEPATDRASSSSSLVPGAEESTDAATGGPKASASATPRAPASARPGAGRTTASAPKASRTAAAQDEDGFTWIDAADLPRPAEEVLAAIDAGGPFEHAPKDGSTFGNYEGVLPRRQRGYYREYTVETPGVNHRGARRIVTGAGGQFYWTDDHYTSFERIRR